MKIRIPALIKLTNPRWVEKIKSRNSFRELNEKCIVKGKELNISTFSCCVVGEALNLFDNDWKKFQSERDRLDRSESEKEFHKGCQECVEFSYIFLSIIVSNSHIVKDHEYESVAIKMMERRFREFEKHLKDKHPEVIKRVSK
jgi:hypothetical protein